MEDSIVPKRDYSLDNLGVFTPYVPFSTESYGHPGNLEETTSLHYSPHISDYIIQNVAVERRLSNAQLDAVKLACQAFTTVLPTEERQGFFLGDGAGVGKNKIIAGVFAEEFTVMRNNNKNLPEEEKLPEKGLWVSVNKGLKGQAAKELYSLSIMVPIIEMPTGVEILERNGIIFTTYNVLTQQANGIPRKDTIKEWLGEDFNGVIAFDEAHKAKNFNDGEGFSSQMAKAVVELQHDLPNAKILYSSATGLSDVDHLKYITRLGLYGTGTDFNTVNQLTNALKNRGVSATELLILELKSKGLYISRTLSMKDIKSTNVVCDSPLVEYNDCALLWNILYYIVRCQKKGSDLMSQYWSAHQRFFSSLILSSKIDTTVNIVKTALEKNHTVVIGLQSTGEAGFNSTPGTSPFFNGEYSVARSIFEKAVLNFASVSFPPPEECDENTSEDSSMETTDKEDSDSSLSSSSESEQGSDSSDQTNDQFSSSDESAEPDPLEEEVHWVLKHWNFKPSDEELHIESKKGFGGGSFGYEDYEYEKWNTLEKLRSQLIQKLKVLYNKIRPKLPGNPLDVLIENLGGSQCVAEMTGRNFRLEKVLVKGVPTTIKKSRNPEKDNKTEQKDFMEGNKRIAIISDACSIGISLHDEIKPGSVGNHRVHLTIEFAWSPDRVVQQLGRTNRSNQHSPPEYVMVVSKVAAEQRFTASIATKLRIMGALTRGDRMANATGFETFPAYTEQLLFKNSIVKVCDHITSRMSHEAAAKAAFIAMSYLDVFQSKKGRYKVKTNQKSPFKFMNRLLGAPLELQIYMFDLISQYCDEEVELLKKLKRFDQGIQDIVLGIGTSSTVVAQRKFTLSSSNHATLSTINVNRLLSWAQVEMLLARVPSSKIFWFFTTRYGPILAFEESSQEYTSVVYRVYRPYCSNKEIYQTFQLDCFSKIDKVAAKRLWKKQFSKMKTGLCVHKYAKKLCPQADCYSGKGKYDLHILSGCLLKIWDSVHTICSHDVKESLSVARVETKYNNENVKIVGVLIPAIKKADLEAKLEDLEKNSISQTGVSSETSEVVFSDTDESS